MIGHKLKEDREAMSAKMDSMRRHASKRHRPRNYPLAWYLEQYGFPYLKYRAKVAVAMAGGREKFTAFIFTRLPPRRVTV